MQKGQVVTVVDFEGKKLKRRVIGSVGDVVLICKDEEFQAAQKDGRQPSYVGCRKEYLVSERPTHF